jgi:hypothetical protein
MEKKWRGSSRYIYIDCECQDLCNTMVDSRAANDPSQGVHQSTPERREHFTFSQGWTIDFHIQQWNVSDGGRRFRHPMAPIIWRNPQRHNKRALLGVHRSGGPKRNWGGRPTCLGIPNLPCQLLNTVLYPMNFIFSFLPTATLNSHNSKRFSSGYQLVINYTLSLFGQPWIQKPP